MLKTVGLVAASLFGATAVSNPEEYVNILGGTDSRYDLSNGNTLPLVTVPWGFNSWAAISTTSSGNWWFNPNDATFYGIRCTHQPSPWIGDYGQFRISGSMVDPSHNGANQYTAYNTKKSAWHPYYFKTDMLAYGTEAGFSNVEMTSTSHGSIIHYNFPKHDPNVDFDQTRKIMVTLNGGKDYSELATLEDGTLAIKGYSKDNSGGVQSNFAHHFVIGLYFGADANIPVTSYLAANATSSSAWIEFDARDASTQDITLRVATSLISADQALVNLNREVNTDLTFQDIMSASKSEWSSVLQRVDVESPAHGWSEADQDVLTTFYSALYRMSIFPRQLSEVNADGELVHWSAYDPSGGVFEGPITSDSGFWDAYSTVYPLLSLSQRNELGVMLQGWVNAYKEGSWLPKWASPGYRGCMVGTMGDVVFADAIVNKIPGFDVNTAYEAIRKDAFVLPDSSSQGAGRECMTAYLKYGYIPRGASDDAGGACSEVVSRTLDYLQADYAIAQAATALGYTDDASELLIRSSNYTKLFDSEYAMLRSKFVVSEKWTEPFDEFAWGGDYTEAGPWQYRFSVPYDAKGLSDLYSSAGVSMCDMLDKTQTMNPVVHLGGYSTEIHEQSELALNNWGQYSHSNQPVHHILYMFGASDPQGVTGACAAKGQYWLRKAMKEFYRPDWKMFTGDEDNGQMSAWYVLSSLGLYSLSPSSGEYVLGSPQFAKVTINIDDESPFSASSGKGKTLVVESLNNSPTNVFVQEVRWNDQKLADGVNSIKYSTLMEGGVLSFTMGAAPAQVKK